jgi:hypothetical protein
MWWIKVLAPSRRHYNLVGFCRVERRGDAWWARRIFWGREEEWSRLDEIVWVDAWVIAPAEAPR